jgi:orotate phosphoribosyltransferase
MQKRGGYWHHDGNLNRPYALLTSGLVSNFYANCSVITRDPQMLAEAVSHLLPTFAAVQPRPSIVIGSAYGAMFLAYELASQLGNAEAWFTTKGSDGTMGLDRFEFSGKETRPIVFAEDVVTTFKTTLKSIRTVEEKAADTGAYILPYVFCLVNRTGQEEIEGYRLISLIENKMAKNWEVGQNPFLPDGRERVEPVRPKQNWNALTRDYPDPLLPA